MDAFDKKCLQVPAKVGNRFSIMWGSASVRLMFGDRPAEDQETTWHTQVAMPADAIDPFIELLQSLKAQFEAKSATKQ